MHLSVQDTRQRVHACRMKHDGIRHKAWSLSQDNAQTWARGSLARSWHMLTTVHPEFSISKAERLVQPDKAESPEERVEATMVLIVGAT